VLVEGLMTSYGCVDYVYLIVWTNVLWLYELVIIRYVMVFVLLYFSRGLFVYSFPPVHVYI
jgi:hypothetical protein